MAKTDRPNSDEFELSLFGPGKGECLVVHLGNSEWMIVDSCLTADRNKPIALEYLEQLGVDISTQVKLIVVTHWHDDHIRGIATLLNSAASAQFVCSAALCNREFFSLVLAGEEIKLVDHTSGVSEFSEVLDILDERVAGRFTAGPDCWATSGTVVYPPRSPFDVEVRALSPSSQTITDAAGQLAQLMPKPGNVNRRFRKTGPNDHSVVLLVHSRAQSFLLGADLEQGQDDRRGWRAIVGANSLPAAKSTGFKVAHHGSDNADLAEIWEKLLVPNPHAALTPYAAGRKPRPSEDDIQRLRSRTNNIYCTVWPPTTSPPRRGSAVDRTMKNVTLSRRAIRRRPGHVRLRAPILGMPDDVKVELFDGACTP